jgi:hypothetical protein
MELSLDGISSKKFQINLIDEFKSFNFDTFKQISFIQSESDIDMIDIKDSIFSES